MTAKRDRSIEFVLEQEGPGSDHPNDKGGLTFWGITEAYDRGEFQRLMGYDPFIRSPRGVTEDEAKTFYERSDWKELRCEELEWPLCLALLDFGVNAGRGRAVKALQETIGAKQDGLFGPKTMEEYELYVNGCFGYPEKGSSAAPLAGGVTDIRLQHLCKLLLKPSYQPFMLGWMRRIVRLQVEIHKAPAPVLGDHYVDKYLEESLKDYISRVLGAQKKLQSFSSPQINPKSKPSSPTSEMTSPSDPTSTPMSSSDEPPGTDSES